MNDNSCGCSICEGPTNDRCGLYEDELPLSVCCGVEMPDWPDYDLCPACLEHSNPSEEDEDDDA